MLSDERFVKWAAVICRLLIRCFGMSWFCAWQCAKLPHWEAPQNGHLATISCSKLHRPHTCSPLNGQRISALCTPMRWPFTGEGVFACRMWDIPRRSRTLPSILKQKRQLAELYLVAIKWRGRSWILLCNEKHKCYIIKAEENQNHIPIFTSTATPVSPSVV